MKRIALDDLKLERNKNVIRESETHELLTENSNGVITVVFYLMRWDREIRG